MEFKFGPDNYNIPQIVVSQSLFSQTLLYVHFFTVSLFTITFFHNHCCQNVTVNRLDPSRFEGTPSATFQHSIETEDENFSAIFLRSVFLILHDDSECPQDWKQDHIWPQMWLHRWLLHHQHRPEILRQRHRMWGMSHRDDLHVSV